MCTLDGYGCILSCKGDMDRGCSGGVFSDRASPPVLLDLTELFETSPVYIDSGLERSH